MNARVYQAKDNAAGLTLAIGLPKRADNGVEPADAAYARPTLRLAELLLSQVLVLSEQYREISTKTVYRLLREALAARMLL